MGNGENRLSFFFFSFAAPRFHSQVRFARKLAKFVEKLKKKERKNVCGQANKELDIKIAYLLWCFLSTLLQLLQLELTRFLRIKLTVFCSKGPGFRHSYTFRQERSLKIEGACYLGRHR